MKKLENAKRAIERLKNILNVEIEGNKLIVTPLQNLKEDNAYLVPIIFEGVIRFNNYTDGMAYEIADVEFSKCIVNHWNNHVYDYTFVI